MSVGEMSKVALQSYIPLPSYRFDTSKTVEHKADSFALVKFDGNKYSVPYQYSNKTIFLSIHHILNGTTTFCEGR